MSDEEEKPSATIFDVRSDTLKNVLKEALKEWVQEQWQKSTSCLGKKMIKAFFGALFAFAVYIIFWTKIK